MRSSETVIDTVKHYPSLTRLEIRTTPQELAQVVQFASQMDHLSRAAFMGVGNTDISIADDAFKSLQTLRVEGRGVEGIRRIVSGITSADLQQLEVTWAPESTQIAEADILPSLDRFPKLKVLRLSEPASLFFHSCLAPALKCSGLEDVSIRGRSSDFSQDVLRTMAQSWRGLRHLQLAPADPLQTGILPLGMLRCFAELCPKLETLAARVRLDLTDNTPEEMRQEAHGAGPALRLIDVGRSVIVLPEPEQETNEIVEQRLRDVATSLLASWPNLTTLKCDRKGAYAEGWARLQYVLNVIREAHQPSFV
ncbi:hypothetical protein FRC04_011886 [Tulasnella sp. 424]|nr:hypothetical protein FRC04_011886 [Tulasnella sp. 424]KAG8963820.1 hypothetical protein FRC05_004508 [Tulasnella sp. 425]